MNILIKNTLKRQRPRAAVIRTSLRTLLSRTGNRNSEVSVVFVGDRAMRTLNRTYRGKDRTTDVLSFPFRDGRFLEVQPDVLGDIVISVPAAERQAREAGVPFASEIDRLLIHGFLHLLGYDHEHGAAEARRMEARERRLRRMLEP